MYRWDGGFIMVERDRFEEAVQWYQEIFGWECVDQITTWVGRKAFMRLPRSGMVTLKSFEGDFEHFQITGNEGKVKLGFATYDLEKTITFLSDHNINSSEVCTLPNGQKYCDIQAFDQTKLTVIEEQRVDDDKEYPKSGVLGFGAVNSIIHVKNPDLSAEWYKEHLGFDIVEVNKEYAHLRTEDAYSRNAHDQCFWDHIWLVKSDEVVPCPNDNKARTYYDIRPEFVFEEYNKLIQKGIKPSELAGDPLKGWGGFHFYDPDYNRINVWSYQTN